jgi:hypothetical protein
MNTDKLARATFVISKAANDDLAYLARRMQQSRSSLVRDVLEPGIQEMAAMLRAVPDHPGQADLDLFADTAITRVDELAARVRRELGHG